MQADFNILRRQSNHSVRNVTRLNRRVISVKPTFVSNIRRCIVQKLRIYLVKRIRINSRLRSGILNRNVKSVQADFNILRRQSNHSVRNVTRLNRRVISVKPTFVSNIRRCIVQKLRIDLVKPIRKRCTPYSRIIQMKIESMKTRIQSRSIEVEIRHLVAARECNLLRIVSIEPIFSRIPRLRKQKRS